MPKARLAGFLLLPELELIKTDMKPGGSRVHLHCDKRSEFEVCPRCATASSVVYDRRTVTVKDEPVRGTLVVFHIRKRRLLCKPCGKPFTEPVPGIQKGNRTTERYKRGLLWACENFSSLTAVMKAFRCSAGTLYKKLYQQLERNRKRDLLYAWPPTIGMDEHSFKRNKKYGRTQFATMVVDYKGKRLRELVNGKTTADMTAALSYIPGRENVRNVVIDMCDPYRSFVKNFFPNAKVTADKFHVLRLLHPHINRRRREITGDKRSLPIRKLLLRSRKRLKHYERNALDTWLEDHEVLREIYRYKEAMHSLYRVRGYNRAKKVLTGITDRLAKVNIEELQRFRRTLMRWRKEILEYFNSRLTNARTEGFNNKAKLVKKAAYGYKNFEHYRLRLLNACS